MAKGAHIMPMSLIHPHRARPEVPILLAHTPPPLSRNVSECGLPVDNPPGTHRQLRHQHHLADQPFP